MHVIWALFSHVSVNEVGLDVLDYSAILKLGSYRPRFWNTEPFTHFETARKRIAEIRYRPKGNKLVPDWHELESLVTDRLLKVLQDVDPHIETFTIPTVPYQADDAYMPASFSIIRPSLSLFDRILGEQSRLDSVAFLQGLGTERSIERSLGAMRSDRIWELPLLNLDIRDLPPRFVASFRRPMQRDLYRPEERVANGWHCLLVDQQTLEEIFAVGCVGIVPLPIVNGMSLTAGYTPGGWDGGSWVPLRRDLRPWLTGAIKPEHRKDYGERQWFWRETSARGFTRWCRGKFDDGSWVGGGWREIPTSC